MGGAVSSNFINDESLKIKGDSYFRLGQHDEAIYYYTLAITSSPVPLELNDSKNLSVLFSNRSAAFSSNNQHEKALSDAIQAIEHRRNWSKGYYRAATASFALERLIDAQRYLEKALALSPEDETLIKLQAQIQKNEVVSHSSAGTDVNRGIGWAYSWGSGEHAQLGLGLPGEQLKNKSLPTVIDYFRGIFITSVSCGAMHRYGG
jgi:tetratricopeptide (TPR) repeat protein